MVNNFDDLSILDNSGTAGKGEWHNLKYGIICRSGLILSRSKSKLAVIHNQNARFDKRYSD
jgi:hypothetical protein